MKVLANAAFAQMGEGVRGQPYFLLVPLLLVPAVLIQALGPSATSLLRYDRDAILHGQLWRLLSGHLVHLSATHLLLNGAALALLVVIMGGQNRTTAARLVLIPLVLMIGASAGLLLFNSELDWYVGLSGMLHGVAVWVAADLWRRERPLALILLIGLALKLLWEQLDQPNAMLEQSIGGAVIVDAHFHGAATAVVLWFVAIAVDKWKGEGSGVRNRV